MKRDVYQLLKQWKGSARRKPLVLRGARQVGKTHILKTFGAGEYQRVFYFNFDEEPGLASIFARDLVPARILSELETRVRQKISAEESLIIFDEIQECPEALNSLKYFCEKKPDYHIVTAGSLLGVKLTKGFPVGKVNFLDLTPLNFLEFLAAVGDSRLRELLEVQSGNEPLSEIFHEQLLTRLKQYLVVGGMPEAVGYFSKYQDYTETRAIQKEILDAYVSDFAKHAPKIDLPKIMAVWARIPDQLAKENKKFIFTAITPSARAREYESALQWLLKAGLIISVTNITRPALPLSGYSNASAFKIYLLDVGLLGAMSHLDPNLVLAGDALFKEYKGALLENYVAQELNIHFPDELYYWTSSGEAEVDFVVAHQQKVYPLEVKSGYSRKKKSLLVYGDKYLKDNLTPLSRTSPRNFALEGNIRNYPLYAVGRFPISG